MKLTTRDALFVLLLLLPALAGGEEMRFDAATGGAPIVLAPEVEIGCIPPNKPNCPPLGQEPCLPPMYPPHPPHYPLCQECHWMWPNPMAWCRKLYGHSADRPPFAPWVENPCGSVDCDFVRPREPLVRRYGVAADALFLFRDDPDLVAFSTTFDADLTSVNEIDIGVAPRVSMIVPAHEFWDFEASYFGLDSWNMTADYDLASGDVGALEFTSELHSAEFNVRHNTLEWLTLLAGFRYIGFMESVDFTAPAFDLLSIWQLDTRNNLYGAQLGADIGLLRLFDRFEVTATVKGGVFGNDAEWRHAVENFGSEVVFENEFGEVAFAGEWSLGGAFRLNDHSAIRGGYQMLWLKDVSKAINSFSEPDGLGSLLMHGGYVGVELWF
jgi:hypothetical protein